MSPAQQLQIDNFFLPTIMMFIAPVLCIFVSSLTGFFYRPGPLTTAVLQHFSGGVVISALAVELLPLLGTSQGMEKAILIVSFCLGLVLTFIFKQVTECFDNTSNSYTPMPSLDGSRHYGSFEGYRESEDIILKEERGAGHRCLMLLLVIADVFLDGFVLGLTVVSGKRQGVAVCLAVSLELILLGFAAGVMLDSKGSSRRLRWFAAFFLPPLVVGAGLLGALAAVWAAAIWQTALLAFGTAAFLFMVVDELLMPAGQRKARSCVSPCFFVGFLVPLCIGGTGLS